MTTIDLPEASAGGDYHDAAEVALLDSRSRSTFCKG